MHTLIQLQARLRQTTSLARIARLAGLTPTTVYRIRDGKQDTTMIHAERLIAVMDLLEQLTVDPPPLRRRLASLPDPEALTPAVAQPDGEDA